jgi:hypothetical protein
LIILDNHALPVLGGIGGAATIMAVVLGPWFAHETIEPLQSSPPGMQAPIPTTAPTPGRFSIAHNDLGPWQAVCGVFTDNDIEDFEPSATHPSRREAGVEIHPPLSTDEGKASELLEEETKKLPDGRLLKFVPHRHYKANLTSCLPPHASDHPFALNFLIATIPDPLGSHMSLEFDREIVAIERAASQADFVFERYWFPWTGILKLEQANHSDPASDLIKQQLRQQPGLLIFRKRTKPDPLKNSDFPPRLLVFLVGETPTGGINKVAFNKAVVDISQLSCDTTGFQPKPTAKHDGVPSCALHSLKVLGPTYSGSFGSLYRAMLRARDLKLLVGHAADVVSPNTTIGVLRKRFCRHMTNLGQVTYLSPSDDVIEHRLIDYLLSIGYSENEVAYLSEDETAYHPSTDEAILSAQVANCSGDDNAINHPKTQSYKRPATLTYPRDLSTLRNAWAPSSETITPADISGEDKTPHIVPFSLHEQTSNELDSPSAFATEQAAPDVDQALKNLIMSIRHRGYRVLIITASNPLDQVYLLQYMHHNATDLRLVTYGQDSMMLRATLYERLRGSISVTPFPLLDSWSIFGDSTAQFPDSTSEGVALGALLILNRSLNTFPVGNLFVSHGATLDAPQRATLINRFKHLGIYTLGNNAFWPISSSHPSDMRAYLYDPPVVPRAWYLLITILAVIACLHMRKYGHIYCPHGFGRLFDNFHGSSRAEDMAEDLFLYICSTQLATLFWLVIITSFFTGETVASRFFGFNEAFVKEDLIKWGVGATAAGLTLILTIISVILHLRIAESSLLIYRQNHSPSDMVARLLYLYAACVYPIITVALWYGLLGLHDSPDDAAFRTMYAFDGLSPLPVIGAVTMIWYLFGVLGLEFVRAVKLMRVDPVLLDGLKGAPDWVEDLQAARGRVLDRLERVSLLKVRGVVVISVGYLVLYILQAWIAFRGVDKWWLRAWSFYLGCGFVGIFLVVEFGRVWSVWKRLESMFVVLENSPLQSAFDVIPHSLASVKLWQSPETRQSPELQRHTLSRLVKLAASAPEDVRFTLEPYVNSAQLLVGWRLEQTARAVSTDFKEHVLLNTCFDFFANPAWYFEEEIRGSRVPTQKWFLEECSDEKSVAREYLVLRYLAMIRYVNAQLRYLLLFILFAYVLLIVGLETYPFEGQRSISGLLTVIFMIIFGLAAVMIFQMDRNSLLSRLEQKPSDKTDYWNATKGILGIGGIPLIAILASQFPFIARFLLSWVKPVVDSLH